ncbi:MAG: SpoIID/LytB domain-containing protein [Actinomycetota bacterium]
MIRRMMIVLVVLLGVAGTPLASAQDGGAPSTGTASGESQEAASGEASGEAGGFVAAEVPGPLDASDVDDIVVEGRGWGHGRGMGQYGSLGYALDGWTSRQILDHFYGGTSAAQRSNSDIFVHLTGFDVSTALIVTSSSPYTVGGVPVAANNYSRIEFIGPDAQLTVGTSCTGPWAPASNPTTQTGTRPQSGTDGYRFVDVTAGSSGQVSICRSDGATRAYRGTVVGARDDSGFRWVGNRLPLETYLRGVVPRESPASWGDLGGGAGIEALKAQAVAARSYALALAERRRAQGIYATDTCDTTSCQVYGGASGDSRTDRAVSETAGEVREWPGGDVVLTEFASSTGGYTWNTPGSRSFTNVIDEGDSVSRNPNHFWTVTIPRERVEARYPQIGEFRSIEVTDRNGLGSWGGRVREIEIVGSDGTVTLTNDGWDDDSFRRAFGLRSDWYRFPQFETGSGNADDGFWIVKRDGDVEAFGEAVDYGDAGALALNQPMVSMAAHPSGEGYWLLGRDGGVFSYGVADFFGSTGGLELNAPVVGMAAHPSGDGYWFVASDGGIFSYGEAEFYGSMGGVQLVSPIVGMSATPTGEGYWLVAADGGIFAFGDAPFHGSIGGTRLAEPIVGMAPTATGNGYWFVASDGGVFAYGDATFLGSATSAQLPSPVVGIAAGGAGAGYWLVRSDALSYSFGVIDLPSSRAGGTVASIAGLP